MSNIIVLTSDEHNPFVSSVYGHTKVKTPNMERLAKMGTVFKNAYCPSPLCMPARSAFVSGRRVHEIQAYSNCNINLNPDYASYGSELVKQDVYTVFIGKTDVYANGDQLGFSEMILPGDRRPPGDSNFCRNPMAVRNDAAGRAFGFGAKETAAQGDQKRMQAALDFLTQKAPNLSQPWSLHINITNPHFPHYAMRDLWEMYEGMGDMPEFGTEHESANHPYARDLRDHFQTDDFTKEQILGLRHGYLACVTYVDRQIGRILEALEETGQLENTNFIYTSDHGDMLGKFGMWWKCSLYEDSVRIPCFAAGPDFEKGKVVDTPVDSLDIQATIFKSVGADRPVDWTGKPLQEIEDCDKDRVVFSEYHGHGTRSGAYLIRKGDWKLIYCMAAPHLLFNLKEDPHELLNVYEKYPAKADELEAELRKICNPEGENERAHQFQDEQISVINSTY